MTDLVEYRGRGQQTVDIATSDHEAISRGSKEISAAFGGLSDYLGKLADGAARREGAKAGTEAGLEAKLPARSAATKTEGTETGVTSGLVGKIHQAESSGRATVTNPNSSATGAGQFLKGTWLEMIRKYRPELAEGKTDDGILALRTDAALSREMTGRYLGEIKGSLKAAGVPVSAGSLYLGYFAGPGGAKALMKADPGMSAADALAASLGAKKAAAMVKANREVLAGKTAGDVIAWAGRKMGKTGSALPTETAAALSSPPGAPSLALSGGGTIRADAYDAAAMRTYGFRLEADIDRRMALAFEEHSGSPADLRAAVEAIRTDMLADPAFAQPEMRAALERTIVERSTVYERKAAENHRIKVTADERAAAGEAYETARDEIERTAYLAGADPEGGAAVDARLARATAGIDAAVEGGAISAAEGAKRKRALVETAGLARVGGAWNALPDAAAKEAFATKLMADWAEGKGPLAGMDFSKISRFTDGLKRSARAEARTGSLTSAADRETWKRRLADDLASIEATGEPLELDGEELDPGMVRSMLGEAAAERWLASRSIAEKAHAVMGDLESLTPAEMSERLATIRPKAGQSGFKAAQDVYDLAVRRVNAHLRLREKDPAAAVDRAFPDIEELRRGIAGGDPAAYAALVRRRLDAEGALGIPEAKRRPLTAAETNALVATIEAGGPEGGADVVFALANALKGDTDKVFAQLNDGRPGLGLAADFAVKSNDKTALRYLMIARSVSREDGAKAPKRDRAKEETAWRETYGTAMLRLPGVEGSAVENAWAIYRGMYRSGAVDSLDPDEDGFKRALEMAVGATWRGGKKFGGTAEFNGAKVLAPADMEAETFSDVIEAITDEDLARMPPIFAGIKGLKVRAEQIHDATLLTVRPGQYWVSLGKRDGRPVLLMTPEGEPWVLDLDGLPPRDVGDAGGYTPRRWK